MGGFLWGEWSGVVWLWCIYGYGMYCYRYLMEEVECLMDDMVLEVEW